jgi:protein O-mannosyl-transferase
MTRHHKKANPPEDRSWRRWWIDRLMSGSPDDVSHDSGALAILWAAILVIAVFLAYQPAWNGSFVWDDDTHLVNNPVLSPGGLAETWTPGSYINYWPLTFSVYRLEYELWGLNPLGFHLVNIALHAAAALLVWRILLLLRVPGAMLAAAIFALHPVNVESVAWISQLKNVLSLSLGLAAMLFYLLHEQNGRRKGDRHLLCEAPEGPFRQKVPVTFSARCERWRLALAVGLFFLSTLSKGMMLTLPLVLLACAWWQRGRIDRRDLLRALPFFVIAVAMTGVEVFMQHSGSGDVAIRSDNVFGRAAVAGCAVWFYLWTIVWPVDLVFVYPRWDIDAANLFSYVPGLLLAALLVLAWQQRRSWGRPVVMLIVCYVALLLPALGFVSIIFMQYSLVADHWQYAAMIVPCAVLAGVAATLARGLRLPRAGDYAVGLGVLTVLSVLTFQQSEMYRDIETLYRTTIDRNPRCWLAQNNLGRLLLAQGHVEEAISHYEDALKNKPDYFDACCNLANVLASLDRADEAIPLYREALKSKPDSFDAHYNLAVTLAKEGRLREAIEHYHSALEANQDDINALNNLAWLRATHPRSDLRDGNEAVKLAERASRLTDDRNAIVMDTLAAAYAEARRFPEAAQTARKAIDLAQRQSQEDEADERTHNAVDPAKNKWRAEVIRRLKARLRLYQSQRPYRDVKK